MDKDMANEKGLENEGQEAVEEELEMKDISFDELKKLAKVSAEALVEESRQRAELEQELQDMRQKADDLQDGMLRLQAEFENFRKRTQGEMGSLFSDGIAEALTLMLPIIDNLQRALEAAQNADDEGLYKGIGMCIDQFMETFGKAGLEEISALGEDFDPNLHEAIMQQPCDDQGKSGKVAEVMQKGYKFKDKILRYSVVQVYG